MRWGEFRKTEPELAGFAEARLRRPPAYLATVKASGAPRVHPVTPIISPQGLYVFMEPTSPKGIDLRERRLYAMHKGVPDEAGTGGEVSVSGQGRPVDDTSARAVVASAASYDPADRYVLFELTVEEVRCLGYGDTPLPDRQHWKSA